MKLYDEYKKVLNSIGKIEKAYFTTFNMDIEFVEKYILPPLLGEEIPTTRHEMEYLNTRLVEESKNASLDIKFFHDANTLLSQNKNTLVKIYPILIKGGVFHPKVIYLKGENATYLFVGSGNLTISGWGRNVEAFEIIKIEDDNLENQVLDFFDEVFIFSGLKQRKPRRSITFNNDTNFVFSFTKEENSVFLNYLNVDKSLQIYSPYFAKDLADLFKREEFNNLKRIDIVPDLIGNITIRLTKESLEEVKKDERVTFFNGNDLKRNDESLNHSKIWISDSKYAVGSYNCSEAALYGKNFEASIIKSYENKEDFDLKKCKEVELQPTDSDSTEDEIEIDEDKQFKGLFILTADYKKYSFKLETIIEPNEKEIYILLPSFKEVINKKDFASLEPSKKSKVFKALVKNKSFEIQNSKKDILYKGFVLELNATLTNRVTDHVETLEEFFMSSAESKDPTEAHFLKNEKYSISHEDEYSYKRKNKKNIINYYSMYSSFKNLNAKFKRIKEDTKKLDRFCYTSASSLEVSREIIESEIVKGDLFTYLMVLEFNKLVRKVNRKLEKDKKMKQLEMKIKLSKKDKKFIEVIK